MSHLLYMRSHDLSSPLLRFGAWSEWAHVVCVASPDLAFEARLWNGVTYTRRPSDIISRASRFQFSEIDLPNERAGLEFLWSQVGKPYDISGVFGIGVHRDWQDPTRWFCSEFAAAWAKAAGLLMVDTLSGRVSQQHLFISPLQRKLPPNVLIDGLQ